MEKIIDKEKMTAEVIKAVFKSMSGLDEWPVKEKHIRTIIIGTYRDLNAITFWMATHKLQLKNDRIAAWKFCFVLHKLLRDGHPIVIEQSQTQRKFLENLGKLSVTDNKSYYEKLLNSYCTLLIGKLDFHKKNPQFPGNLAITLTELNSICANDNNKYFQLSIEIMDYLDRILDLQNAIFQSITNKSVISSSEKCRLSPLNICVQEAFNLYEYGGNLLSQMHSLLNWDMLNGHRERFFKQFEQITLFYQKINEVEDYSNFVSVTDLVIPKSPPNFDKKLSLQTVTQKSENAGPVLVNRSLSNATTSSEQKITVQNRIKQMNNISSATTNTLQQVKEKDDRTDDITRTLCQKNTDLQKQIQDMTNAHKTEVIDLQTKIYSMSIKMTKLEEALLLEQHNKSNFVYQITPTAPPS